MKYSILSVILAITTDFKVVVCQDFGYDGEKGPVHWGEQYNTCKGKYQSPINIDKLAVKQVALEPLRFEGFDIPATSTNVTNNGHTVMVTLDTEQPPQLDGGPLNGVYEFAQFHFHWGDNDTLGSENLLGSKSFAMELHVVMYKKIYRNARAAISHPDGLAVLAFFFEVSSISNPMYGELTALLQNITQPQASTRFKKSPALMDFLSMDLMRYYTYNGSLTTPPCSEVVTWIDFEVPILLSHDQLEPFRALQNEDGEALTHNFRPIQPLGDRIILYNVDNDGADNRLDPQSATSMGSIQNPVTKSSDPLSNEDNSLDGSITTVKPQLVSKKHNKKSHSSRNFPVLSLVLVSVFVKFIVECF